MVFYAHSVYSQDTLTTKIDTIQKVSTDSIPNDSLKKVVVLDSLKKLSDFETPVKYKAKDSVILDFTTKYMFMYKDAQVDFEDMKLKSEYIDIDMNKKLMHARGKPDTNNIIQGKPVFKDAAGEYFADEMTYNYETKKGIIVKAYTNQDGDIVGGDKIKKIEGEGFYVKNGSFTTCNLEHPHYVFYSKKIKVIPEDKIITGAVNMRIADFPTPLVLPFGFFPNTKGKKSGILLPTYGENLNRGFFFKDLGYYWAVNDYVDLFFLGDIYTNGWWRAEVSSNYNVRYKYNGGFSFEYSVQKDGQKTDPDYSEGRSFFIQWKHKHRLDASSNFTADVRFGSSNFLSLLSYDVNEILTNELQSSIAYSKTFQNAPYSIAINSQMSQNTQNKLVNLTLPSFTFTRTQRLYPFKRKVRVGTQRWYEKIGASYNAQFKNVYSNVPDSVFFTPEREDYVSNGLQHSVGINTNLKALGYINLTPSINYTEFWHLKTIEKQYFDDSLGVIDRPGFATARSFSTSLAANTALYGIFNFKGKKRTAIRHTIRPTLTFTYQPNFAESQWGFYKTYQDSTGKEYLYNRFEGNQFSGPGSGEVQSLSLSVSNLLEMKFIPQKIQNDTVKTDFKRFNLIDNFGFNTSYNFVSDSLNLSPVNWNVRSNIRNNMVNFQFTGVLDPYAIDTNGTRINKFLVKQESKLARLTNFNFALGFSLTSPKKKQKKEKVQDIEEQETDPEKKIVDPKQFYASQYAKVSLPWTLNIAYKFSYSNPNLPQNEYETQSLQFNGTLKLTPKWKITFSSGYDFENQDLTLTQVSVYRDLHCWEMSFSAIPFGSRTSFTFNLNVKASSLKDLKVTKRRDWQDEFYSN